MLAAIKSTRFCGNYTEEGCINRPTTFARTSGYLFPARRLECALPRNPCFPERIFGNLRDPALVGKELQGKVLTQSEVFGFVHHTHAPSTDPAKYAVMGNRLPNGLGGRSHWQGMVGRTLTKVNRYPISS